jgi:hypothetical protein
VGRKALKPKVNMKCASVAKTNMPFSITPAPKKHLVGMAVKKTRTNTTRASTQMSKKDIDQAMLESENTKNSNSKLKDFLGGSSNKEKMVSSFGRSNSVAI